MTRHRIEQAVVTLLGFFVGTILAFCITPGDVLLWLLVGIALAIFSRAFFICDYGGELFQTRQPHGNAVEKKPVLPQH
jgi:hypothetical protein